MLVKPEKNKNENSCALFFETPSIITNQGDVNLTPVKVRGLKKLLAMPAFGARENRKM